MKRLKADPSAITDVDAFQATMDTFEAPNPYMNGDAKLRYVGMSSFGQTPAGRSATGGKCVPETARLKHCSSLKSTKAVAFCFWTSLEQKPPRAALARGFSTKEKLTWNRYWPMASIWDPNTR